MLVSRISYSAYIVVIEHGEDRGIMVSDHEAGTVEPLGLVDQHVATLVISIISNHYSS